MSSSQFFTLILLSAIWGGSFIFMRVLAPVLGPILTADLRILISGLFLTLYILSRRKKMNWKAHGFHYFLVGIINCAIPFSLFSYAALHIPASYSVVLNATSPLFGALCSIVLLGESLDYKKIFGLFLGITGVTIITHISMTDMNIDVLLSIAACLLGALLYALAAIYIKKYTSKVPSLNIAAGAQLFGGILLLPLVSTSPLRQELTPFIIANMLGLALICSALAFVLYYKLLNQIGPTKALTVTFLMPIFGILWGYLLLDEEITLNMLFGAGLIISGTFFVLKSK